MANDQGTSRDAIALIEEIGDEESISPTVAQESQVRRLFPSTKEIPE
jgi:hypothetical protein